MKRTTAYEPGRASARLLILVGVGLALCVSTEAMARRSGDSASGPARFCSELLSRHPALGKHGPFSTLRRFCIVEIANAYLDSIDLLPPGEYFPDLPRVMHPDARRWINRSRVLDPPTNEGRDELLAGVEREPDCDFENRRWVVEGDVGSVTMDVFCAGYAPAIVRDRFLIEKGLLSEIEVMFISVNR